MHTENSKNAVKRAALLVQGEAQDPWYTALAPLLAQRDITLHCGPDSEAQLAIVANPSHGVLAKLPRLQLIASLWAGVDKLLSDPSLPTNIPILRACDEDMRDSMAQSAAAHALTAHLQLHQYRQQQAQEIWHQLDTPPARLRSVGVLGAGYIGSHVAITLKQLGFAVSVWSRSAHAELTAQGIQNYTGKAGLSQLIAQCEILINVLPATAETTLLFNAQFFGECRPNVSFINIGRGSQVDETALLAALDSGQVAHAALDVFAIEPLPSKHRLWAHPNVTVTPHVAGPSHIDSVSQSVCKGIFSWLESSSINTNQQYQTVNRQLGY